MNSSSSAKIVARNVAAIRRFGDGARIAEVVAGNPAATRLESGVGNCFPGLECDLRNLERRFFPFMEIESLGNFLVVAAVDLDAVDRAKASGSLALQDASIYQELAEDLAAERLVLVARMEGTFGVLGVQAFNLAQVAIDGQPAVEGDLNDTSSGPGRRPADAWTAVRLLTEGTNVTLTFRREGSARRPMLTAPRARYLDDNGALSAVFLPGELTQSLCSPWTHDFRDCGCFYWASNHPDIVLPVLPSGGASGQDWNRDVPWERSRRLVEVTPPPPATAASATPIEMRHYEINNRWQELHFVLGRREIVAPHAAGAPAQSLPLPSLEVLQEYLRYAAGVELAVAQEYLSAAYSLKLTVGPNAPVNPELRNDIRATRAELLRIAIGEMRHVRAVNDILRGVMPPGAFVPALGVATKVPGNSGQFRNVQMRAATREAILDFIQIEAPSAGVDGLYSRILATLVFPPADVAALASEEWCEAVRSIIAEGEDHFQAFKDMQEWLADYAESDYLHSLSPVPPPAGSAENQELQTAYAALLRSLLTGYKKGRFGGAAEINGARASMVSAGGIDDLAQSIAAQGYLVVFEAPAEADFAPVAPPPSLGGT